MCFITIISSLFILFVILPVTIPMGILLVCILPWFKMLLLFSLKFAGGVILDAGATSNVFGLLVGHLQLV